jgi:hypothetical protein
MVNLLRVFQRAQYWAAKKVHTILLDLSPRESKILNQSTLELGFQLTLSISQTPLHINWARGHWKKMWSTFSISPHRAHSPSDGPCLARIWSLDGKRPRASCQVKILIFGGIA